MTVLWYNMYKEENGLIYKEVKPVKNKEVENVYNLFIKNGIDTDEQFEESVLPSVKYREPKKKLIEKMKQNYIEKIQQKILEDRKIQFYEKEVEFLHSLPNEKIKRLFYSLLCFEKLHWHGSGWIRFEIDELAELGGLKNLRCEDFADLVPFGLDMRVTGSKNAVTTYGSIWIMISQKNNGEIGDVAKTISGLECAEKFWEVVNGTR